MIKITRATAIALSILSTVGISSGIVLASNNSLSTSVSADQTQQENELVVESDIQEITISEPVIEIEPTPSTVPVPTATPTPEPTPTPEVSPEEKQAICDQKVAEEKSRLDQVMDKFTSERKASYESKKAKIIEDSRNVNCNGKTQDECLSMIQDVNDKLSNIAVDGISENEFLTQVSNDLNAVKQEYCN
jgi:outer membrane biosynthesis protein TonB